MNTYCADLCYLFSQDAQAYELNHEVDGMSTCF